VAQKRTRILFIISIIVFFIYFFIAARPIPREIVLIPRWINTLNTRVYQDTSASFRSVSGDHYPFSLGSRFGFVSSSGDFLINRERTQEISLGKNMWTEYPAEPDSIVINNILYGNEILVQNPGGYPFILDDRIFILGSEQNSLSEISGSGNVLWSYDFGSPLTAIDAAAGLVVTGSLDGLIEVFNSFGERIFHFETSGSRYLVILGCAISHNGNYIGVISGIDQQRFMLFERAGSEGDYRINYHEFTGEGFRRPVHIWFVDDDQRVIYERMGGIDSYNIRSRRVVNIPLDGEISAIDESGGGGYLFLITSHQDMLKKLVGIRFQSAGVFRRSSSAADAVFLEASFKSDDVYLNRSGAAGGPSMFVIGGGTALISFDLEER